jgi:peptidyl-prolyl cis-trans isomerase C
LNQRLIPVGFAPLLKGETPMARATARHILVATEAKCNELKVAIEGGADFAVIAKENSTCPSSRSGGDLGSFGPGQMVKEFDTVVFSAPVNTVQGPVKTQFGYHLLEVTSRQD